jgi:hypothetical protein
MGSKTAADTESGKFTKAQAEENGWVIYHQQDPKAVTARGTGGNIEVLVSEGKYVAEKTVDDHLITAVGTTEDEVLEAIRSQQASIDNGIRRAVPLLNGRERPGRQRQRRLGVGAARDEGRPGAAGREHGAGGMKNNRRNPGEAALGGVTSSPSEQPLRRGRRPSRRNRPDGRRPARAETGPSHPVVSPPADGGGAGVPGKAYRSIKKPKVYEALRREGMTKTRAAKISNAQAKKKRKKRKS